MEQTNTLKMGSTIAALRKSRGLTQEQLAALVGVSGPAVSKWETDASCPDVALLCPLARALNTTVDALLQFEAALTDEEVARQINALMETLPQKGADACEEELRRLVCRWPGCTALQFNAAMVCDGFEMFFPDAQPEQKARWRALKRELLERVRASGTAAYWQAATIQLAGLALAQDDPDRAEALLDELPEHPGDATAVRALLYRKRGQEQEAQKLLQTQLYAAVSKAMTTLSFLLGSEKEPRRRQKLVDAYQELARAFGLAGWAKAFWWNCTGRRASGTRRRGTFPFMWTSFFLPRPTRTRTSLPRRWTVKKSPARRSPPGCAACCWTAFAGRWTTRSCGRIPFLPPL